MIRTVLFLILLGISVFISNVFASDQDLADKYYPKFSHQTDGTGMLLRNGEFVTAVPLADRPEVLAQILDRASRELPPDNVAIAAILFLLGSTDFQGTQIEWTPHLTKAVESQAKSPAWDVRNLYVRALLETQKEKAHDVVLSFLKDPDDRVRCTVLNAITQWPDAQQVYEHYLQAHQSDKNYTQSLSYAKGSLNIIHRNQP